MMEPGTKYFPEGDFQKTYLYRDVLSDLEAAKQKRADAEKARKEEAEREAARAEEDRRRYDERVQRFLQGVK